MNPGAWAEEGVHVKFLRPLPPAPPVDFLAKAKKGKRLELAYLDGW